MKESLYRITTFSNSKLEWFYVKASSISDAREKYNLKYDIPVIGVDKYDKKYSGLCI